MCTKSILLKRQNANKIGSKQSRVIAVVGTRVIYFPFLLYTSCFDKFSIVNVYFCSREYKEIKVKQEDKEDNVQTTFLPLDQLLAFIHPGSVVKSKNKTKNLKKHLSSLYIPSSAHKKTNLLPRHDWNEAHVPLSIIHLFSGGVRCWLGQ